eukprot:1281401-Pyramimonas_sp.AAC.2
MGKVRSSYPLWRGSRRFEGQETSSENEFYSKSRDPPWSYEVTLSYLCMQNILSIMQVSAVQKRLKDLPGTWNEHQTLSLPSRAHCEVQAILAARARMHGDMKRKIETHNMD